MVELQRLTDRLGDAISLDDVAREALHGALRMDGVVRAGLAVSRGAGRDLKFVSTDDDAMGPDTLRWCLIDGLADVPLAQTVRDGRHVLLPSLEHVASRYPDLVERQRRLGIRSLHSVPLVVGDTVLGGLLLSFEEDQDPSDDDLAFLKAFSAQVAHALRRGLAYHAERSVSERLQRSLLPHSLPEVPGLALAAHYQPGGVNVDIGGDWYDVLQLRDGSVLVSLGDVMGKGVSAAIVMSEVRAALRAYAVLDPTPGLVLARLDGLVSALAGPEQVVTVICGRIDPGRRLLTLAVAGHPPPFLVPATGDPELADVDAGPALGLGSGPWPEQVLSLDPDTTVLFYSDGLVETRTIDIAEGQIEVAKDIARMAPHRRTPRELNARLAELVWHLEADDDVTTLAAAVTAWQRERTAALELPADPTAARAARSYVTERLASWGVPEAVVDVAQLCTSELVTNAVIHSSTAPSLSIRLEDDRLRILIHDEGGRGVVHQVDSNDPLAISGRGLALVEALSSAWGAEHSADGTTVWFELEAASGEPDDGPPAGA